MSSAVERERQKKKDLVFREVDVYHKIQNFAKLYTTFSESIPKPLCKVNQSLHEAIAELAVVVFKAANEPLVNVQSKVEYLSEAESQIKTIYCRVQYLISVKCIAARKWDFLSRELMSIYDDIQKWQTMMLKKQLN